MQQPPDEAAFRPAPDDGVAAIGRESGWARVEHDGIVRGWVVDYDDLSRRIAVDVFIDDRHVGHALAAESRPDLDFGDRAHGLVFKVPADFRDGQPHLLSVRTVPGGFELKSRNPSFLIGTNEPLGLSRLEVTGTTIRGEVNNPVAARWPFLHVHAGLQAPDLFPVRWSADQRARFVADLDAVTLRGWLENDARLSYHGEDRSLATPLWSLASAYWEHRDSHLVLRLSGLPLDRAYDIDLIVESAALEDAGPAIRGEAVNHQTYRFDLPDGLPARWAARADLRLPNGQARTLGSFRWRSPGLIRNGAFSEWSGRAPEHWAVSGASLNRGAPPPLADGTPALGYSVVLMASGQEPVRLRQVLQDGLDGRLSIGLRLRSTAPAAVVWRLEDAGGTALAEGSAASGRAWDTVLAACDLGERGAAALVVEIDTGGAACAVEIAAIDIARHAGDLALPAGIGACGEAGTGNLIANPDLFDWPDGRLPGGAASADQPRGWRIVNAEGPPPALGLLPVRLLDPVSSGEGYALSIAAADVPRSLRLEVALEPLRVTAGTAFQLSFVATPRTGRDLFAGPLNASTRWSSFARVILLARNRSRGGAAVVARFCRGLVLQAGRTAYAFDAGALPLPEAWIDDEYDLHLVFEAEGPMRFTIDSLSVTRGRKAPVRSAEAGFEDPHIRAQVDQVSLERFAPASVRRPSAPAAGLHWRWPSAMPGSVEVVICVHDALDETLQCLDSLQGASALPHTVAIVDDASCERTARALDDHVAGKPWMRVITNAENKGYTRSADLAIRQANAELVVLLNSDTLVHAGWLERMIACLNSDPRIAFVGPLSNAATYQSVPELRDAQGRWAINALPDGMTPAGLAAAIARLAAPRYPRVPLLNGFCTLMRRDIFLEVGGLDGTAFPTGYGEENDLCLRVRNAGYDLAVADDVYVYHHKSASFGSARRAALQKQGDAALREKHAGVDFAELGRRFSESQGLIEIRDKVRDLYLGKAVDA